MKIYPRLVSAHTSGAAARTLVRFAVVLCCVSQTTFAAIEPDFLMDSDPQLNVPARVANFNPELKKLWISALERPEADMQRMAAETIARAHQHGIPDLITAVPSLEKIVQSEASHPAARYAACRALIVLQSRESSEKLLLASKITGADLRQLVEPALADWEYSPARAIWIERLESHGTKRRDLILAIRGLAQVREQSALQKLLSYVEDLSQDADIRLEAAAAVGQIADTGLEKAAERLAGDMRLPYFVNQLCAIRMLARHSTDNSRPLLLELATHAEPAVAAAALSRLNDIDSALVVPLAESAMKSRDPNVRTQGAASHLNLPTPERIRVAGELLADVHPRIRQEISEGLLRLAEKPELRDAIYEVAMRVLSGDQRQAEAILLLGELEYKPAASRLVELLESPDPKIFIAAAWALRKVAVPETIPAMIDKAKRQTEQRKQGTVSGLDEQVAHLFEAMGVLKSKDARPLLMQYVSKDFYRGDRSRGAAIWAIGRLMEGEREPSLERALSNRINDFADRQPETALVKQMCTVALVRMNVTDQAPMLRGMVTQIQYPIELAFTLRWAVEQLTGEEMGPPEPLEISQGDWFLVPIP